MMTKERIQYGPFGGQVELREDILRHASDALTRAIHMRNAVGIVTIGVGTLRVIGLVAPVPWSDWSGNHGLAVTFSLLAAWLLAAANVWSCRQRFDDCRTRLMEYV